MKKRTKRRLVRSQARGLTLIEVVASVALLASLLVATLSIRTRHIRQINRAFEKKQAVALLDHQVAQWFESEDGFPIGESGEFESNASFRWEVVAMPVDSSNPDWDLVGLRIDVISTQSNSKLVSLELVDFFDTVSNGPEQ